MISNKTFTQSFSSLSVFIFDRDFNWFITCMQRKPFRCELLLHCGTYQDATLAVLRLRASMDAYTASSGHVTDKRQHTFEAR